MDTLFSASTIVQTLTIPRRAMGAEFGQVRTAMASLADVFVPVFEVRLEVGHEFAGVGAVDDAVVEA